MFPSPTLDSHSYSYSIYLQSKDPETLNRDPETPHWQHELEDGSPAAPVAPPEEDKDVAGMG